MKPGHERPVDRVAARVVGKCESYEFKVSPTAVNSSLPLPVRQPSNGERGAEGFIDLTGTKFGRLTVIGMSAEVSARWVVRCVCGSYGLRKSSVIKTADASASCHQCHLLAVVRRKERIRLTGRFVDTTEFLK